MKSTFLLAALCFALSSPASAQVMLGNALALDGDGDYVLVPDDPSLDFETMDSFTIMAWFRTVSDTAMRIVYKLQAQEGLLPFGYGLFVNSGIVRGVTWSDLANGLSVDAPQGTNPPQNLRYNDGQWHHVAFMREGVWHKLYIDGVLIHERNDGLFESIANPNFMTIGAAFPGVEVPDHFYFNGLIDEVQIWKRSLTINEIEGFRMAPLPQSVYENPSNGIVAYYNFEEVADLGVGEAGANDIRDLTLNGNHGDLMGDAAVNEGVVFEDDFDMPRLTVKLWSVSMYWGRKLELRVVDTGTGREVGRRTIDAIDEADEFIYLDVLRRDKNYRIDFYVDVNENGVYDPPPVDAAWRLMLEPALGNDEINFAVDFNFIDIAWPALPIWERYEATWTGTGMNGGLGTFFTVYASMLVESGAVSGSLEISSLFDYFDLMLVYFGGTYSMDDGSGLVGPVEAPPGKADANRGDAGRTFHLGASASSDWTGTVTIGPDWSVTGDLEYVALAQPIDVTFDGTIGLSQTIVNIQSTSLGLEAVVAATEETVIDATAINTEEIREGGELPRVVALSQNYPNPVYPTTAIPFRLERPAEVTIGLYDVLGRRVATLLDQSMNSGEHEVEFDGSRFPSGMYVYRMTATEYTGVKIEESKKLVILK